MYLQSIGAVQNSSASPSRERYLKKALFPPQDCPPNGVTARMFDGGLVTLHKPGSFEAHFRAHDLDVIAFSLDAPSRVYFSLDREDIRPRTFSPGQAHFLPARTTVFAQQDDQKGQILTLCLDHRIRFSMLKQMDWTGAPSAARINLRTPLTSELGHRLRSLFTQTAMEKSDITSAIARTAMHDVLSAIHAPEERQATRARGLDHDPLQRAICYIEENLEKRLTLSDIAQAACKSPFHFAKLFKDAFGISPFDHVIEKRLERSKVLLRHSILPISHIAEKCGFNSPSHFSKTFRARTGRTPRQYRQFR